MSDHTCAACGKPIQSGIQIGGVLLCRPCSADIEAEITQLRADGKPVNVTNIARRMFRETYCIPGGFLLRDIPAELWDQVKLKASDDRLSIRDVILNLLQDYVKPSQQ
jgi:hypothetical protein